MKCKICGNESGLLCNKEILDKYSVRYYRCKKCKFIQTEKPYWLKEAYTSAIIDTDTGILMRNTALSKVAAIVTLFFLDKKIKILDYAGGYGIMTRMLRDIGLDCYWSDKYAENIFAKLFPSQKKEKYDLVTAFEVFEHLENPVVEIKKIIKTYKPKIILFSTMLHNGNPDKNWWYFVPQGGQHISLFTKKSLKELAKKTGMKLSTNGKNLHILSSKRIPSLFLIIISITHPVLSWFLPLFYKSKTFSDHQPIFKK